MPHCIYVDGNMLPPSVLGVVSLFTECQNILLTLLYIRRWKQSISVTNIMYVNRISTVKRFSKMIVNCLSFLWFWQLCKHHIVAQHLNCCMSSNPDPAPSPEQASQDCFKLKLAKMHHVQGRFVNLMDFFCDWGKRYRNIVAWEFKQLISPIYL